MRRPPRSSVPALALALPLAAALCALQPSVAAAQSTRADNPYRYDVRGALFPVLFLAGLTQRSFGSGLRGELDLGRRITLELGGAVPWVVVGGEDGDGTFSASAGLSLHVIDEVGDEPLAGTVHPKDYAAPTGRGNVGTDSDLETPISSRLGGPAMTPPEHASSDATGPIRSTHSLRLGYHLARSVQRGRPDTRMGEHRYFMNTVHALYLGYGFGQAWNLSAATVGERELGYRRFYVDALLTLDPLVTAEALGSPDPADGEPGLLAIGGRLGMQGSIDALVASFPGFGFAYTLELGALPGKSGFDGRLLIALGIELDGATRPQ